MRDCIEQRNDEHPQEITGADPVTKYYLIYFILILNLNDKSIDFILFILYLF